MKEHGRYVLAWPPADGAERVVELALPLVACWPFSPQRFFEVDDELGAILVVILVVLLACVRHGHVSNGTFEAFTLDVCIADVSLEQVAITHGCVGEEELYGHIVGYGGRCHVVIDALACFGRIHSAKHLQMSAVAGVPALERVVVAEATCGLIDLDLASCDATHDGRVFVERYLFGYEPVAIHEDCCECLAICGEPLVAFW